jgi:hypothetical protein
VFYDSELQRQGARILQNAKAFAVHNEEFAGCVESDMESYMESDQMACMAATGMRRYVLH